MNNKILISRYFNEYSTCSNYNMIQIQIAKQWSVMSWRQSSTSKQHVQKQHISETTRLRLQHTKLKIEIQQLRKEVQYKSQQLRKCDNIIAELREQQEKYRACLARICNMLGCGDARSTNVSQLCSLVQKHVTLLKQKCVQLEIRASNIDRRQSQTTQSLTIKYQSKQREYESITNKLAQKQEELKKSVTHINLLVAENGKYRNEIQSKSSLLAQLSHRVTDCQIQNKDLQSQIKQLRACKQSPNKQQIKKQCEDLIGHISIRDDDYLKSYLLKNQRYYNGVGGSNSISRKNKHDFIFQQ